MSKAEPTPLTDEGKQPLTAKKKNSAYKRVVVIGDLFHQHALLENDDRLASPDVKRNSFSEFSFFFGTLLLERFTRFCAEHHMLLNGQVTDIKQAEEKAKELVNGPSWHVANNTQIAGSAYEKLWSIARREHITYRKSKARVAAAREAYRIGRNIGHEPKGTHPNPDDDLKEVRPYNEPTPEIVFGSFDFVSELADEADYDLGNPENQRHITGFLEKPLVCRFSVGPELDTTDAHFKKLNSYYGKLVGADRQSPAIAVISASSLRACGYDISFRKTWERTISDTVRSLQQAQADEHAPLSFLGQFDWVVISFYSDGALAVPLRHPRPDASALFVVHPSSIEQDLFKKFDNQTKGTETLISQALVNWLATNELSELLPELFENQLAKAVLRGLKASRFLLMHGMVEVKSKSGWFKYQIDPHSVSSPEVQELANSSADDSRMYLWNRTRASAFLQFQCDIQGRTGDSVFEHVVTWPYGDLVEILSTGNPDHGTFPPVYTSTKAVREEWGRSTSETKEAFTAAGWLQATRIPLQTIEVGDSSEHKNDKATIRHRVPVHDNRWWSFERLYVDAVRSLLDRVLQSNTTNASSPADLAAFLLDAWLVLFGDENPEPHKYAGLKVELQLLSILFSEESDHLLAKSDANLGVLWQIRKCLERREGWTSAIGQLDSAFQVPDPDTSRSIANVLKHLLEQVKKHAPVHTDINNRLGVIPYLRIGKLHVTSRRESQGLRDLLERIETYKVSRIEQPLNIGVFGPAGSGKSFGTTEIVKHLFGKDNVDFHTFNLAGVTSPDSLADFFLRIQDSHLRGKFPVAFWDEYDTSLGRQPLGWLPHFLGPMNDGEFVFNGYLKKLPRCLFVFAGSMFSSFGELLLLDSIARNDHWGHFESPPGTGQAADFSGVTKVGRFEVQDWLSAKGSDFKSRLGGILDVRGIAAPVEARIVRDPKASPEEVEVASIESEDSIGIRKARSIRFQLTKHFPSLISKEDQLLIRCNTLGALLREDHYSHGLRSIQHAIGMFAIGGRDVIDSSVVPTGDQRRIHMSVGAFDEE